MTATAKEFAGIYRGKRQHESDLPAVLDRALAAGCQKIMLTGMSLHDIDFNLDIASSRPEQVYITAGVHPYHVAEIEKEPGYLDRLEQRIRDLLSRTPCPLAAFGELGLDYDHLEWADRETQHRTFRAQLDVAVQFDLPLFLHCRSAFEDFVMIIQPYLPQLPQRGLVHSFVGSKGEMEVLVNMGFGISVNGFSFKDSKSLQMVAAIPLERLQIETDAPWGFVQATSEVAKKYLVNAPAALQSKKKDKFEMGLMVKERNESCMIDRIAFIVAGLKDISVEDVAEAAWKNSVRMFGLGTSIDADQITP